MSSFCLRAILSLGPVDDGIACEQHELSQHLRRQGEKREAA
jgi:hypothetical protein